MCAGPVEGLQDSDNLQHLTAKQCIGAPEAYPEALLAVGAHARKEVLLSTLSVLHATAPYGTVRYGTVLCCSLYVEECPDAVLLSPLSVQNGTVLYGNGVCGMALYYTVVYSLRRRVPWCSAAEHMLDVAEGGGCPRGIPGRSVEYNTVHYSTILHSRLFQGRGWVHRREGGVPGAYPVGFPAVDLLAGCRVLVLCVGAVLLEVALLHGVVAALGNPRLGARELQENSIEHQGKSVNMS